MFRKLPFFTRIFLKKRKKETETNAAKNAPILSFCRKKFGSCCVAWQRIITQLSKTCLPTKKIIKVEFALEKNMGLKIDNNPKRLLQLVSKGDFKTDFELAQSFGRIDNTNRSKIRFAATKKHKVKNSYYVQHF
jgi:hypothetical protein